MTSDTAYCPEWYPPIQAARYLGVPPWDLVGVTEPGCRAHPIWADWANIAATAEAGAQRTMRESEEARARANGAMAHR